MFFPTCEKNEIQMIRGTTKTIVVTIRDAAGNPYALQAGDVVRFGVKAEPRDADYLIQKTASEAVDGVVTFVISPEDTAQLDFNRYKYDVGLQSGADYFNVIPYSSFLIVPNITAKE